jgi:YVTN family beta-propeller protein
MNLFKPFRFLLSAGVLLALSFFAACTDDPAPPPPAGANGFFVVNEGAFGASNASLSFYNRQNQSVTNNIFVATNNRPLGDQAQSMTVWDGKGYVVVQNSQKIEVIDARTFRSQATITEDIVSPRYFLGISRVKAYVSDWGADGLTGTIKVIDLAANRVVKTVRVGRGPNRMCLLNNRVYVANSGGFGSDNTISVLDANSDEVLRTITTADNPNSIDSDVNGNLWVTCGGRVVFDANFQPIEAESTRGAIVRMNADGQEQLRLTVARVTFQGPADLQMSKERNRIFYRYLGAVWAQGIADTSLPATPFLNINFYGIAIDPFDGSFIGCRAPNFVSAGTVEIYSAGGQLQRTLSVGIGPTGCAFP